MIVYIIVEYLMPTNQDDGSLAILGVFDNEELAIEKTDELYSHERHGKENAELVFYDVLEYEMNVLTMPTEESDISEELEELVKSKIIDYMIGEDGEFHFHLTDKGKEFINKKRRDN